MVSNVGYVSKKDTSHDFTMWRSKASSANLKRSQQQLNVTENSFARRKTLDSLNVVSRAINVVAQDKDYVEVCALVNVELASLERAL